MNQQPHRPEQNERIPHGSHPIGPTSIEGVEARDFPDQGRGSVDTDPAKVKARNIPSHTGETLPPTGDVGLRGTPDIAKARDHGNRKHN
jgi:hypothetical protein